MNEYPWELLTRQLAGTASPEEEAELRRWVEEDPSYAQLLERLTRLWEAGEALPEGLAERYHKDEVRARLLRRIAEENEKEGASLEESHLKVARRARTSRAWRAALRRAAVIIFVVGAGAIVWKANFGGPPEIHTVAALRGQRTTVTLPDGSEAMLGTQSEIQVAERFGPTDREVRLKGMAYFRITPDARRPFIVRTDGVVARVVGTRFLVRAYGDEGTSTVVVEEGEVAVRTPRAPEALEALVTHGQLARAEQGSDSLVVGRADLDTYLDWTQGHLQFKDALLSQVLTELERWYEVTFHLKDPSIGRRHITVSFEGDSLEDVLAVISVTLNVRIERDGTTATLYPNGTHR